MTNKTDVSRTAVKLSKKHQLLVLLQRHVGHMDSLIETNGGFVCPQSVLVMWVDMGPVGCRIWILHAAAARGCGSVSSRRSREEILVCVDILIVRSPERLKSCYMVGVVETFKGGHVLFGGEEDVEV